MLNRRHRSSNIIMKDTKRILVLGAGALQVPLIKKIKSLGYEACVVSLFRDEPGMLIADHPIIGDYCEEEEMLHIARVWNVCGIAIDQTDLPVRTAAYVAERLGLPGIGYETAKVFTDKYAMRERCRQLGLPTLLYQEVDNVQQAREFFAQTGDVILKPVCNQGSKGVYRATTIEELERKYEEATQYSRGLPMMLEEFVVGEELVIESCIIDGHVQLLICGDTFYFNIPDTYSANMRLFPSKKEKSIISKAEALNNQIIEGFGIHYGITHGEYIIRDGEVYLIEIAARGGGCYISSHIIPLMTEFDSLQFIVNNSVGLHTQISVAISHQVACYVAFYLPEGTVTAISGINEVKLLPYVCQSNLDSLYVGKNCPKNTDKTSRYFMVLKAPSYKNLSEEIYEIKSILYIEVMSKGIQRNIIWDSEAYMSKLSH